MRTDTTVDRPTSTGVDRAEGLVRRYTRTNAPLAGGEVLPAIPDEFVAALARIDGHDPAAFRQVLAEFNVVDAAALTAILRVVRHYGATAALGWAETEIARTAAD
jgi:hypothetical protein